MHKTSITSTKQYKIYIIVTLSLNSIRSITSDKQQKTHLIVFSHYSTLLFLLRYQ